MNNILKIIILISIVCVAQTFSQISENQNSVILTAQPVKISSNVWEFKVSVKNNYEKNIYLMTEPEQVNGEKGHYLQLDKSNEHLLQVSSRVYTRQLISPYSDSTGVRLIKLKPTEIFEEKILLKFPLKETSPPIGVIPEKMMIEMQNENLTNENLKVLMKGFEERGKKLDTQQIQFVRFSYGYFVEETGIIDFLNHKPFGWYIKGHEKVLAGKFNGQSLLEIQNLTTSDLIKINPNPN